MDSEVTFQVVTSKQKERWHYPDLAADYCERYTVYIVTLSYVPGEKYLEHQELIKKQYEEEMWRNEEEQKKIEKARCERQRRFEEAKKEEQRRIEAERQKWEEEKKILKSQRKYFTIVLKYIDNVFFWKIFK
jgi:hypothetical protein